GVFAEVLPHVTRNVDVIDVFESIVLRRSAENCSRCRDPQPSRTVFVYRQHGTVRQPLGLPGLLPASVAEPKEALKRSSPDRTFVVLEKRQDIVAVEAVSGAIQCQLAVADSANWRVAIDADPNRVIASRCERGHDTRGKTALSGRPPWLEPHAVEAIQSTVSRQPQIAVLVLIDCADPAGGQAVVLAPRREGVIGKGRTEGARRGRPPYEERGEE